ncbi:voltage-gated potassium channel [Stipitochalara longipes BDJ]|nr:voltage-gated potassium channel [Stipitochalara longipes BDJ]
MATLEKNPDEKPMRSASTEPSSPELDPTTTQNAAGDKDNGLSEDIEGLDNSEIDVWEAEKAGEGYFMPIRVWCASVLFPLCAGCFGPLASAFGICAITQSWRVQNLTKAHDNMYVGTDIKDPEWLLVPNGLSLALSLLANISLLLSMANRLPFSIAQFLSILSFFGSSIILIVITSLANSNTWPVPQGSSLSASFYFACISAGISLTNCLLLSFTFYYAKVLHEIPTDLTMTLTLPQRTLMVQSLGFIIYIMSGAAIFSSIEGWRFTDAIYWATVTLLTIGFGDMAPTTHTGRSLIIPFATSGIVMIGLVIGSIGTLVLDRGAKKMFARMTVNSREKKIRLATQKLGDSPISAVTTQSQLDPSASDASEHPHILNEKAEFTLMREVQSDVSRSQHVRLFIIATVAILALWLLGGLVFWTTEKASQSWSYFDGLYFCFIALMTIGYGDLEVSSAAGKAAFVYWAFLAVPTMTILVASMGATFLIAVKAIIHKIDDFVVLPHEGRKDSYLNKMHKMGKLKVKAKFGHRWGWSEHKDGRERHWHHQHGEGIRNPDTGVVHHDHRKIHQNLSHDEKWTHADLLYQLAREIRELLPKLSDSKGRKYTYEEWTKFIHLLNHDASKKDHISTASWSWLDDSSPLFRHRNETAWILERLSMRLEEELKKDTNGRDEGKGITEE